MREGSIPVRKGVRKAQPKQDPAQQRQTLKFLFSPAAPLAGEPERENPHAKATTYLPEVVEALREAFGEDVLAVTEYAGEHTVYLAHERIVEACRFLKEEQGFTYLSDFGAIDRFTEEERFEVYYNLVNMQERKRLRLKVRLEEDEPVASITGVYRAANWHEREAWDMFGIRFEGHPDLRRMFMPEDFEHHPLRREFPVLGIPGSLPLPPQRTDGASTLDPFARAHGQLPED